MVAGGRESVGQLLMNSFTQSEHAIPGARSFVSLLIAPRERPVMEDAALPKQPLPVAVPPLQFVLVQARADDLPPPNRGPVGLGVDSVGPAARASPEDGGGLEVEAPFEVVVHGPAKVLELRLPSRHRTELDELAGAFLRLLREQSRESLVVAAVQAEQEVVDSVDRREGVGRQRPVAILQAVHLGPVTIVAPASCGKAAEVADRRQGAGDQVGVQVLHLLKAFQSRKIYPCLITVLIRKRIQKIGGFL